MSHETDYEFDGATVVWDDDELDGHGAEPVSYRSPPRAAFQATPLAPRTGQTIYFDLETVPDYERLDRFGLPEIPEPAPATPLGRCPAIPMEGTVQEIKARLAKFNPPQEWVAEAVAIEAANKNRRGVLDALRAAHSDGEADFQAAHAERRKLLSVTPEYCRVAALGWAVEGEPPQSMILWDDDHQRNGPDIYCREARLLEHFWTLAMTAGPLVGFNVLSFDLPVIFVRSAILGVPASRQFDLRPWGGNVLDLMRVRFPAGKAMKLKDLARLYGINVPAGDCDGSQVERLLKDDPAKVGEYVRSDIHVTRELHRFYSGYFCV